MISILTQHLKSPIFVYLVSFILFTPFIDSFFLKLKIMFAFHLVVYLGNSRCRQLLTVSYYYFYYKSIYVSFSCSEVFFLFLLLRSQKSQRWLKLSTVDTEIFFRCLRFSVLGSSCSVLFVDLMLSTVRNDLYLCTVIE